MLFGEKGTKLMDDVYIVGGGSSVNLIDPKLLFISQESLAIILTTRN
jgi:hypothetical protein